MRNDWSSVNPAMRIATPTDHDPDDPVVDTSADGTAVASREVIADVPVQSIPRRRAYALSPVALLVGLAAGWQWQGIRVIVASALDPLPTTTATVGVIVLLAAALGPWVPERFVLAVCNFAVRRARRSRGEESNETGTFWMLRAIHERDESLMWLTFAVITAAAGALSLATLGLSGVFLRLHDWLFNSFFWTNLTLTTIEWIWVAGLVGAPSILLGLVIASMYPLAAARRPEHRAPPGVAAGLCIGLAVAWASSSYWLLHGLSAEQNFMIGVLPLFLLSGWASRCSQRVVDRRRDFDHDVEDPPEYHSGGDASIRVSLVVWGVATGWALTAWSDALSHHVERSAVWLTPLAVGAIGLGLAAAGCHGRTLRVPCTASGCGMAAWFVGVGFALAAIFAASFPVSLASVVGATFLLGAPAGYALYYSERAWLARAGSGTVGFGQLISAILGGLAVGIILARWGLLPFVGSIGLMAVGALMLLAFAGLVQIYEQDRAPRVYQKRLALIFASLAAAIFVFPNVARRWQGWERSTAVIRPASPSLDWLDLPGMLSARRVCLIGVEPIALEEVEASFNVPVDLLPDTMDTTSDRVTVIERDNIRVVQGNPLRAMRVHRERYDKIYQYAWPSERSRGAAEYSAEWFKSLADRTNAGGSITVDVPLQGMNIDTLQIIAGTFAQSMDGAVAWTMAWGPGGRLLRLEAVPGGERIARANDVFEWAPASCLFDEDRLPPRHRIRFDRLSQAQRSATTFPAADLIQWLESRRATAELAGVHRSFE